MFYRRKIILALLQAFDGRLSKISLQKLLFLFTNQQVKVAYDFVPYRYGCYSFSANADLTAMVGYGLLSEDESSFTKIDQLNYAAALSEKDRKLLVEIKNTYGKFSADKLMILTYQDYPYFAINSMKSKEILTDEQYAKVQQAKPKSDKTILFTIGYEGISLEDYLNRLIKHDVKVLVDVRSNAVSMKYGFSRSQLKRFCANVNIEYLHIPEVGILSEQRQELNSQSDYDKLFDTYTKDHLKKTVSHQEAILKLLQQKQRIALTCFEANICQCHRKHLADAITQLPGWNFEIKHI
jgi:uncharacterized protein (DUF488 family)